MKRILKIISIIVIVLAYSNSLFAQVNVENKKDYKIAVEHFDSEEFNDALKIFLSLEEKGEEGAELRYQIGVCYLNTLLAITINKVHLLLCDNSWC